MLVAVLPYYVPFHKGWICWKMSVTNNYANGGTTLLELGSPSFFFLI